MKPKTKATIMTGVVMILVGGYLYLIIEFPKVAIVGIICALVYVLAWIIYTALLKHYKEKG